MKTTQKMTNPYPYSDSNKRYQTFDYYLKKRFGTKIARIALDAGFDCPNRDGTCATGGCIYCSGRSASSVGKTIKEQYENGVIAAQKKWDIGGYIPYLQAGTNTYGAPELLRKIYDSAAELPGAVALAVATRADCLDTDTVAELRRIADKLPLIVELGLQTSDDKTAALINRGHTFDDFCAGYRRLRDAGGDISVCVHLIIGLPGESREQMLASACAVADMGADMVKIHMLHVIRDTKLAKMYEEDQYTPMDRSDYISTVCDMIELLPEDCVIARVTGDGMESELLAPLWSKKKVSVINDIDKEMYARGTYQGCKRK